MTYFLTCCSSVTFNENSIAVTSNINLELESSEHSQMILTKSKLSIIFKLLQVHSFLMTNKLGIEEVNHQIEQQIFLLLLYWPLIQE